MGLDGLSRGTGALVRGVAGVSTEGAQATGKATSGALGALTEAARPTGRATRDAAKLMKDASNQSWERHTRGVVREASQGASSIFHKSVLIPSSFATDQSTVPSAESSRDSAVSASDSLSQSTVRTNEFSEPSSRRLDASAGKSTESSTAPALRSTGATSGKSKQSCTATGDATFKVTERVSEFTNPTDASSRFSAASGISTDGTSGEASVSTHTVTSNPSARASLSTTRPIFEGSSFDSLMPAGARQAMYPHKAQKDREIQAMIQVLFGAQDETPSEGEIIDRLKPAMALLVAFVDSHYDQLSLSNTGALRDLIAKAKEQVTSSDLDTLEQLVNSLTCSIDIESPICNALSRTLVSMPRAASFPQGHKKGEAVESVSGSLRARLKSAVQRVKDPETRQSSDHFITGQRTFDLISTSICRLGGPRPA